MNVLFLHQNCPAQFGRLAVHLARDTENRVVYITQAKDRRLRGVQVLAYDPHRTPTKGIHPYAGTMEAAVIAAQGAARVMIALRDKGFVPDIVIAHPGWGESLLVREVFPRAPLLSYCEFFYHPHGADVDFDPEFPPDFDTLCRVRMRNAHHMLALDAADRGYSPTRWQRAQFPQPYRDRIAVIHDGIDCDRVRPDPAAEFSLPDGRVLRPGDEVLTFIARNLEPYRGFHVFMRALPELLDRRPEAQVVIVGGEERGYGRMPEDGGSWRDLMTRDIPLPEGRVHFTGKLPYPRYLALQQVAAARVYLSYPFVLSWSVLESMAAGCLVIGSKTPPVEEVIEDGRTGRLVDFFDVSGLARTAAEVLQHRGDLDHMRAAARAHVTGTYDWAPCRDRLLSLIADMTGQPLRSGTSSELSP